MSSVYIATHIGNFTCVIAVLHHSFTLKLVGVCKIGADSASKLTSVYIAQIAAVCNIAVIGTRANTAGIATAIFAHTFNSHFTGVPAVYNSAATATICNTGSITIAGNFQLDVTGVATAIDNAVISTAANTRYSYIAVFLCIVFNSYVAAVVAVYNLTVADIAYQTGNIVRVFTQLGILLCYANLTIHSEISNLRIVNRTEQTCIHRCPVIHLQHITLGNIYTLNGMSVTFKYALEGTAVAAYGLPLKTTEINIGLKSEISTKAAVAIVAALSYKCQLLSGVDNIGILLQAGASSETAGNSTVPPCRAGIVSSGKPVGRDIGVAHYILVFIQQQEIAVERILQSGHPAIYAIHGTQAIISKALSILSPEIEHLLGVSSTPYSAAAIAADEIGGSAVKEFVRLDIGVALQTKGFELCLKTLVQTGEIIVAESKLYAPLAVAQIIGLAYEISAESGGFAEYKHYIYIFFNINEHIVPAASVKFLRHLVHKTHHLVGAGKIIIDIITNGKHIVIVYPTRLGYDSLDSLKIHPAAAIFRLLQLKVYTSLIIGGGYIGHNKFAFRLGNGGSAACFIDANGAYAYSAACAGLRHKRNNQNHGRRNRHRNFCFKAQFDRLVELYGFGFFRHFHHRSRFFNFASAACAAVFSVDLTAGAIPEIRSLGIASLVLGQHTPCTVYTQPPAAAVGKFSTYHLGADAANIHPGQLDGRVLTEFTTLGRAIGKFCFFTGSGIGYCHSERDKALIIYGLEFQLRQSAG